MDAWKKEERLLSTKEVFKTTTISERWRHLLPTLVFIEEDFMINDEDVLSKGATGYRSNDVTNYFLFIDKTLAQYATDVNLTKFKLEIADLYNDMLPVNSWIHYAITRNVQEIDSRIMSMSK
uniref:Uncharacterized protein n=1 Tax=Tanacetum cinerariifolium TaxID=118510 RepID=A0A6L2LJC5_TANCI|nr:hypothetical protein [Tanacetum cinerariifolium]